MEFLLLEAPVLLLVYIAPEAGLSEPVREIDPVVERR